MDDALEHIAATLYGGSAAPPLPPPGGTSPLLVYSRADERTRETVRACVHPEDPAEVLGVHARDILTAARARAIASADGLQTRYLDVVAAHTAPVDDMAWSWEKPERPICLDLGHTLHDLTREACEACGVPLGACGGDAVRELNDLSARLFDIFMSAECARALQPAVHEMLALREYVHVFTRARALHTRGVTPYNMALPVVAAAMRSGAPLDATGTRMLMLSHDTPFVQSVVIAIADQAAAAAAVAAAAAAEGSETAVVHPCPRLPMHERLAAAVVARLVGTPVGVRLPVTTTCIVGELFVRRHFVCRAHGATVGDFYTADMVGLHEAIGSDNIPHAAAWDLLLSVDAELCMQAYYLAARAPLSPALAWQLTVRGPSIASALVLIRADERTHAAVRALAEWARDGGDLAARAAAAAVSPIDTKTLGLLGRLGAHPEGLAGLLMGCTDDPTVPMRCDAVGAICSTIMAAEQTEAEAPVPDAQQPPHGAKPAKRRAPRKTAAKEQHADATAAKKPRKRRTPSKKRQPDAATATPASEAAAAAATDNK